jgi:serine/threonine protein kinase
VFEVELADARRMAVKATPLGDKANRVETAANMKLLELKAQLTGDAAVDALGNILLWSHLPITSRLEAHVVPEPGAYLLQTFERCDSDLVDFLYTKDPACVTDDRLRHLFYQIARALAFCHSHGIMHMDVKPDNMLVVRGTGRCRLADFGCAVLSPAPCSGYGTLEYAAPEVLVRVPRGTEVGGVWKEYKSTVRGDKADVWALGITLFGCVLRCFPWTVAHVNDQTYRWWLRMWSQAMDVACVHESRAEVSEDGARALARLVMGLPRPPDTVGALPSEACLDLLVRMLDPRPATRIPMSEVVRHPWLAEWPPWVPEEAEAETEAESKAGAVAGPGPEIEPRRPEAASHA